jgi:hypothetical protein
VVASEDDNLSWVSNLECEEKADDLATLFASVDVVTHEQVTGRLADDLIVLLLLVLVRHLLEHVQQIRILAVDVSENFDRGLKLIERLFILEHFLSLLDEELDHLNWEVDERDRLGILLSIMDNLVVEVVNEDVHDEGHLIIHILLGDVGNGLLELLAPLLLDVQGLGLVLLWFQVLVEQSLKLLPLVLLPQPLFLD